MPIPSADSVLVPRQKVVEYLLNVDYLVGGPKAIWFISLGDDPRLPEVLVDGMSTESG